MGLAVVQQLKDNSGFEHGMLASMFDDRAAGKESETPRLRLFDVNKIENFLNDTSLSHIHVDFAALDELRNTALNIESHDDHVAETAFKYGVKELMKGAHDHDENIAADNGYMKTSNATQSGYNQLKEKRRWDTAMQIALNNERENYLRRLEAQMRELRERIQNIDNALNTLDGKTNDDFKGESEEAIRLRKQIDEDLAKVGKSRNDFLNENGDFDVKKAQEYLRQNRQESVQALDKLSKEHKHATVASTPEISAQETHEIAAMVNAEKETAQIKNADTNDILIGITSSFNTSSEVETTASAQLAHALDNQTPLVIASDTTAPDPSDDMAGGFASMEQIDVTVAQITNRPLGSVAGNLDGSSNSVLSSDFTALAKGEVKQAATTPTDVALSTAPALRTLNA